MSSLTSIGAEGKTSAGKPIRVMIVDDARELRESVRAMLRLDERVEVVGEAEDGYQALERIPEVRPDVVLMDINMPGLDGIGATERVVEEHPETAVVIISVEGDQEYFRKAMRAGARDYLVKPFGMDDLVGAIRNAYRLNAPERAAGATSLRRGATRLGQVVCVFSSKGGVGKTTVTANLAVAVAAAGHRVVVVDLDLEFGNQATVFGVTPRSSIVDVCRTQGPIPSDRVHKALTHPAGTGVALLAAPPDPELAAEVEGEARADPTRSYVGEIIDTLRADFEWVMVDTATNFGETTLTALDRAETILLVTTPEVPALWSTARALSILTERLDYGARVKLVVNRARGVGGLLTREVAEALNYQVAFEIPSDGAVAVAAANSGRPFFLTRKKKPISRAIGAMAQELLGSQEVHGQERPRRVAGELSGAESRVRGVVRTNLLNLIFPSGGQ